MPVTAFIALGEAVADVVGGSIVSANQAATTKYQTKAAEIAANASANMMKTLLFIVVVIAATFIIIFRKRRKAK